MIEPGILTLEYHDDLADRAPINHLTMIILFNFRNDIENSFFVKILNLVMTHHQGNFDKLK
jgi:hypothetical protein